MYPGCIHFPVFPGLLLKPCDLPQRKEGKRKEKKKYLSGLSDFLSSAKK